MTTKIILKDSTHYIEWLERSIIDEHINYYVYSDFKNIQPIGSGSYGIVSRANWKNTSRFFALKSFNNDKQTPERIIKELRLHRSVDVHENIIRLCGITKMETDEIQRYSLVLEYADSGTLNTYLSNHFNELDWSDKFHLASQLASAVEFLHNNDIIHRDLHGSNILIHQKNIKLADFGLSKKIVESSNNTSKLLGVIPYVDPKSFDDKENYKLNKKSDVYSIGVLLWQISSGYKPFHECDYDPSLMLYILNGKREEIIDRTPVEYSKLYTECWKYEPNERPNIHKIVLTLKAIISPEIIVCNIDEDKKTTFLSEKYKQISELSEVTLDINNDLNINNSLMINTVSNPNTMSDLNIISNLNIMTSLKTTSNIYVSEISSQNHLDGSSNASDQESFSSINLIESIYSEVVDLLISYIIKKHDKGITLGQVQELLDKKILQLNQNVNNLIDWLSKNQNESKYIWLLGLFYYYNSSTEENNSSKAFELFSKAANNNYSIAQVYLAKCYYEGCSIDCDKILAFDLCKKSVNNGSIIGKLYLGYCYEFGFGTLNNEKESAYWYNEASKDGNTTAKLYLANCFRLGKGVDKDEIKAFKYYEMLAKQEISDAQLELGNCLYNGIGTNVNKIQAEYWYEKAANKGNIIAKNILKKNYNKKTRINIENDKLYKILRFKNLSQLGIYYVGKILLKANYEKSFYYFQKAAENGCKYAQFSLGRCYQLGIGVTKDAKKSFELFKKSAKQEYIGAQFQLNYCYFFGFGTEINRVKSFELVKMMAKKGDIDAIYLLSRHYALGFGVNVNEKKAFEIIKKLAKNENQNTKYLSGDKEVTISLLFSQRLGRFKYLNAKIILGYCYAYGIGTEINHKKAYKLFNMMGKNGNTLAQYHLGKIHLLKNEETKAFEFFKKSADNGFPDSQFQIGICYDQGIGTETNKIKAIEIIKELAEKGYCCAQSYLGELYEIGKDINKDLKQAVYWYCEAVIESGCMAAKYNLGECYQYGNGVEKDESRAFEYYKSSADQGHFFAQFQLSECYYKGIGIEVNKRKAFESYKRTAEMGCYWGYIMLSNCYQNREVYEDERIFELYKEAVEKGYDLSKFNLTKYYKEVGKDEKETVYIYKEVIEKKCRHIYNNPMCCFQNEKREYKIKSFELYKEAVIKGHDWAKCDLADCYQEGNGVEKDERKAFELYKEAAEKGYRWACNKLVYCYQNGKGVEKNERKVFEIYKEAVKKGYDWAKCYIAECFQKGIGVKRDERKAFELYKEAAKDGYIWAYNKLGNCYKNGIGVQKDEIKAFELYKEITEKEDSWGYFKYYKKSVVQEYLNAQFRLGYCYDKGIGTEINKAKAFELYNIVAKKEVNDAQNNLGHLYMKGEVPEKDSKKAVYWLQKAVKNGNILAYDNLAICYELGIGTEKDKTKAFVLYEKSAEKGYVNAKFHLGYCHINGIGTEINKEKGYELYNEAAEKGNINKINIHENYYKNIKEIEKDLNEANYWYQKSAECNDGLALYKLGEIYELGKGVNKNEARAFDYYKQSAERGCVNGKYKLGNYFFKGIIIDINKERAYNLYKEAAEGGNCDAKKYLALFHNKQVEICEL
ncbi:hypothetical protein RclHR1_01350014 [Rhizophagus clarus]|uniref:Kinase-like domain-containing protein n=1 Tax=Rhizophagus clarus TaxID=94130 RepID=A0A2Z6QMI3_9GLOM|nr:hypothetical protein RclHR1_01350014 [Rhizophagus clarus]GES98953.1 kinase-like domain-containing protein [Rhizophagus clarus]